MELLIGLILPPAIDYLNKHVVNDAERFIVAVITCLLFALIVDYQQISKGNMNDLPGIALVIFAEAQIIFNLYWKNSFLRDKLQTKIGSGVNPTPNLG